MSEHEAQQLAADIAAALLALQDTAVNDTAARDVVQDALAILRALHTYDEAQSIEQA